MAQSIFISYSRKNAGAALGLADRLRTRGFQVWIDQRGIEGASRWTSEIAKAIEEASVVVLLISTDSMASENVMKEIDIALEWKKRIVPVDIEKIPLTRDFMYHLVGLQRVDINDFEAIHRACLKPIESTIVREAKGGLTEEHHKRTATKSLAVRFRKQFHGWRWFTWVAAVYCIIGLLQVTESFLHQGENGEPNVSWTTTASSLQVSSITALGEREGYHTGDTLLTFGGIPVGKGELTDAFYDAMKRHRPGDIVPVVVGRATGRVTISDTVRSNPMPTENRYGSLMCLAPFLLAGLMLVRQPGNAQVQLFNFVIVNAMMYVLPPFYIPLPRVGVGFPGILTMMGAPQWLVGALVLHFASYYLPRKQRRSVVAIGYVIATPATICAIYNAVGTLYASDLSMFSYWSSIIDPNLSIALLLLASVAIFLFGYIQTKERGIRKRIRIIVWSVITAAIATIVVTQLPPLGIIAYIPHSSTIMLVVFVLCIVGISYGLARSQNFDSDLLINKSLVYGAVLGILLLVYAGTNILLGSAFISAVLLAVLFEPSKNRVQKFIDRRFFKLTYNYREAGREAAAVLMSTGTVLEAGEYIVGVLQAMLPTDTAAFFTIDENANAGITFISSANANEPDRYRAMGEEVHRRLMEFGPEAWNAPVGLPDMLEPNVKAFAVEDDELRTLGAALLTPVRSAEGGLKGFFLAGKKTNGWKFSAEDIDLVQSISVLASHALARIERNTESQLHEAERARFERRKKMKSISGSSLPHEVWVMGDNIQTFRAIERKQLAFGPQAVILDALIQSVLQSLGADLMMEQFDVDLHLTSNATIHADPKLLEQAIRTLLSHAMKYSLTTRTIEVSSESVDGLARLTVKDHGVGMSDEEQAIIFEPFKRGGNRSTNSTGAGIGLYVVKHVVEACGGTLTLSSTIGKGTSVRMQLPTSLS